MIGGTSTFAPRGSGLHEHYCPSCQDFWSHNDASCAAPGKPYDADSAYECPDHQPRSGWFYASWGAYSSEPEYSETGDGDLYFEYFEVCG